VPELSDAGTRKRVRVHVSGDVQGVGFRWYTREQAMGAGLAGSVRNLPDGRVEAVFEGDADVVDRLVQWCRKGPGLARVDHVEVIEEEPTGESGFRIEH
jgi:acylphosphatase